LLSLCLSISLFLFIYLLFFSNFSSSLHSWRCPCHNWDKFPMSIAFEIKNLSLYGYHEGFSCLPMPKENNSRRLGILIGMRWSWDFALRRPWTCLREEVQKNLCKVSLWRLHLWCICMMYQVNKPHPDGFGVVICTKKALNCWEWGCQVQAPSRHQRNRRTSDWNSFSSAQSPSTDRKPTSHQVWPLRGTSTQIKMNIVH